MHLYDSNGGGPLKSFYFLGNVEALAFVDRPASGCGKVLKPVETGEAQTRGEGGLIGMGDGAGVEGVRFLPRLFMTPSPPFPSPSSSSPKLVRGPS